jgi:hypothetical protein
MNANDVLKYGHQTVLGTLGGLTAEAWVTPNVCGVWSTKDIVAHLASFEGVLTEILETFLDEGSTPILKAFQIDSAFNEAQVASRKERSVDEVLNEYQERYARVMALAKSIPLNLFSQSGTLPWYGSEYSLDDLIVYMFYGHKREHSAQIALWRKRANA